MSPNNLIQRAYPSVAKIKQSLPAWTTSKTDVTTNTNRVKKNDPIQHLKAEQLT